jgi:beta-phosphoglucomutase-like phosphatase (HAD superfamily)
VHCLVIEGSPAGVEAGRAAGMTVIGLLAASHIPVDHHTRLLRAGAHHVALTFKQAERFTRGRSGARASMHSSRTVKIG